MLKIIGVLFLVSLTGIAGEPPAKDASAEELAKNSWLREQTIELYKKAALDPSSFARNFNYGCMNLTRLFKNLRLDYVERVAREENLEVYLVARADVPKHDGPIALEYLNPEVKAKPKFRLWVVGLAGSKQRRDSLLAEFKKTPEQNAKDLNETAFYVEVKEK